MDNEESPIIFGTGARGGYVALSAIGSAYLHWRNLAEGGKTSRRLNAMVHELEKPSWVEWRRAWVNCIHGNAIANTYSALAASWYFYCGTRGAQAYRQDGWWDSAVLVAEPTP